MCFDTTASNTGTKTEACAWMETELQRNLLAIACRHHAAKLVLEKVFVLHDSAKSPNVDLFVSSRSHMPSIDQTKSKMFLDDPNILEHLSGKRDALIAFATEQLVTNQPRDD